MGAIEAFTLVPQELVRFQMVTICNPSFKLMNPSLHERVRYSRPQTLHLLGAVVPASSVLSALRTVTAQ